MNKKGSQVSPGGPQGKIRCDAGSWSANWWQEKQHKDRQKSLKRLEAPNPTECQGAASDAHELLVRSPWAMMSALTFWEEPGPRWLGHRWPCAFASPLSRMRRCLDFGPETCCWWKWMCLPCTVPTHPSASGIRCKDAHCSSSPPAGHWCWDTEFHLRQCNTR